MTARPVLVFGAGHLAVRLRMLAVANGHTVVMTTLLGPRSPGASATATWGL